MSDKAQSKKKIRSLLTQSMNECTPVRIRRTVERHETEHGVVLDLSADWVLIASVRDGGYLDGYRVFRVGQLRRVESETTFEKFLHQRDDWPPVNPSPSSDLTSPRNIIEAAAQVNAIVTVFREVKRPGRCLIGAPVDWGKKSVWLLTIDPEANWENFMTKIPFKDLTQISFGGDYEKALLCVAGDLPPRTESE